MSVRGTETTAEFIELLKCNHPTSYTVLKPELTDQVATILTAIPPVPNHIFFRYHFPGGVATANNFTLVKDSNWAEGDYMEARAFDTNTGIEMHGCAVGWYPKSV